MKEIITLLIGVMILAVIVFNVVLPQIASATSYTLVSEQWNGVASLPNTMTFNPITSIVSMYIRNGSIATNTVMGVLNSSLLKSLSTNSAWPTGSANLTINCNLTTGETANVTFGSTLISNISYCPVTFTNISQGIIGDPSSLLEFVGSGSNNDATITNTTAVLGGSGTVIQDLYFGDVIPGSTVNLTVGLNVTSPEKIAVYSNGYFIGNVSTSTTWSGMGDLAFVSPVNLTFVNPVSIIATDLSNSTVLNETGISHITAVMTPTCIGSGANVSVEFELGAGANVTYRFMGHAMGNLTNPSPNTFDPDPGWECGMEPVIRSSFETTDVGEMETNITRINISYDRYTNASSVNNFTISYEYRTYDSNFTNASLQYSRESAYALYNFTATAITPGTAGTFLTNYYYGMDPVSIVGILSALIPMLIIISFILLIIAMFEI